MIVKEWRETDRNDEKAALGQIRTGIYYILFYAGMWLFSREFDSYRLDDLLKSLLDRHPGESRGPELLEITRFRLSPE
jgi:hypothetical protein